MHTGYLYFIANPEHRHYLRRINEARSAAVYAAVRTISEAVADGVSGLLARLGRRRRIARTEAVLAALDDRLLRDVGLHRGTLRAAAEAAVDGDAARAFAAAERPSATPRRPLPTPRSAPRRTPSGPREAEGPRRAA
jgi:uncharacterized protein YjiS (DUF1127 family)